MYATSSGRTARWAASISASPTPDPILTRSSRVTEAPGGPAGAADRPRTTTRLRLGIRDDSGPPSSASMPA